MARARRRVRFEDLSVAKWALDEDVFLMDNQDMPLADQASRLNRSEDEISSRRAVLGILQRAKTMNRLKS